MTKCTLTKKLQGAALQWIGMFALLGMAVAFIKPAIALTAFTPQAQPTGYVAQDEISNYDLTSGNETVYRPGYEREFWSGNLYALPVSAAGIVDATGGRWAGAGGGMQEILDAQNYDTGRLIATMKDDGTKIPFRYTSLNPAQLNTTFPTTINLFAATGANIVDFLRGDRTNEGPQSLRIRGSVLGDIIHLRPYYVADATNPTIFVGANDGMLHALNTADGSERWAYVPSMLLSKMINLAKPYGGVSNPHDYFVDGRINIATVTSSGSKRILVGGLGAGGRGLYALDITGSAGLIAASEAAVASKILWEITPTKVNYANPTMANAYVNLGYTYGTPTIAKVAGVDAVIIGNGYNDGQGDYAGCTHATPNYTNCGGDYAAYLYVINAYTGQLIQKIKAGADGTSASPNGLSAPGAIDSNGDGSVDLVYAGDLNGTMWKFDLTASTATVLLTTSPAQPITSTPGVAIGPNSTGYMINFGTGAIFTGTAGTYDSATSTWTIPSTGDLGDTSVHYAYGIWDGAPVANTEVMTPTLEERAYNLNGVTTRVRRSKNIVTPNWSSGVANHKGWKVALPAGERVLGEGSHIESGRFYFTSHNPNIPYPVSGTNSTILGDNWLMELDYLTGGSKDNPFLDLDENHLLNSGDRIKYITGDASIPAACNLSDPLIAESTLCAIPGTDGIPVGRWLSMGVQSQPILVQLQTLNTTLFNQNPDIAFPYQDVGFGVTGGHFDEDIYHNCTTSVSGGVTAVKATATITVGTAGQTTNLPATLGVISVDGIAVFPALTTTDITNGTATTTNATTIKNKVTGGYTATVSGSTVTVSAPVAGASYNGKTFVIADGTSQAGSPAVPAVRPTGLIRFATEATSKTRNSGTPRINNDLSGSASVKVGGVAASTSNIDPGKNKKPSEVANAVASAIGTGGIIKAYVGGNTVTPTCAAEPNTTVCLVDTSTYSNGNAVTLGTLQDFNTVTYTTVATANGSAGSAATGWSNFAPALTASAFSGGSDAIAGTRTTTCSPITTWQSKSHTHQYDDKFDKTGVDMLNASVEALNLYNAVPTASPQFKVIAQNQYLSPAVKINIGRTDYQYNVDFGYTPVRDFVTSANLNTVAGMAALPTYTLADVGSLVINMPIDALTSKNWWGNGDVRSGLHPTQTGCVKKAAGANDGNMYQPVIPPANGVDGPGTNGYSASTTPLTATGVRHNGALTIQVIKANTPDTAIEENVPGRPEYGWRVKSADYNTYVYAEYTTFWHHPNGKCYGDAGWIKAPPQDNSSSAPVTPAAGSTDPKLGDLSGGGGTVVGVTRTVAGNVTTTTITYSGGGQATIVRTVNPGGSVTFRTRAAGCADASCETVQIIAASGGGVVTGATESRSQARTGRVSWHELIRQ
ncbi:MAG: hypothetical protein HY937_04460 [Nitrosomonadales bacterium]|nr:hypothetical protein [Nitrosomonadales bacterium]